MKRPKKQKSEMSERFEEIRREVFGETSGGGESCFSEPPPPPAHLGETARAYWVKLAALLVARQQLKPIHLEPLAALCQSWETYLTCRAYLGTDLSKWVVANPKTGVEKESVQVRLMRAALSELQVGWARFGCTAHSESRLVPERIAAKQRTTDPHTEVLRRVAALRDVGDSECFRPR